MPEIVDYDLPVAGAFHNCVIVSIRKTFPGQAQKIMHAVWGLGLLSLTKCVVVVDDVVDVHDYEEVFFRVTRQRRPEAGRPPLRGPARPSRPRAGTQFVGGKLGIDATAQAARRRARGSGRTRSR